MLERQDAFRPGARGSRFLALGPPCARARFSLMRPRSRHTGGSRRAAGFGFFGESCFFCKLLLQLQRIFRPNLVTRRKRSRAPSKQSLEVFASLREKSEDVIKEVPQQSSSIKFFKEDPQKSSSRKALTAVFEEVEEIERRRPPVTRPLLTPRPAHIAYRITPRALYSRASPQRRRRVGSPLPLLRQSYSTTLLYYKTTASSGHRQSVATAALSLQQRRRRDGSIV